MPLYDPTRRSPRRTATVLLAGVLAAAPMAIAATPAAATTPAVPTGQKVAAVSHSAVTVTSNRAAHATKYRLHLSTRRSDVYVANIGRSKHSTYASSPRVTVRGLGYTTATYWYRVEAANGSSHRYAATIGSFHLRPNAPTSLRVTSSGRSFYLTWSASGATGYRVEQATNSSFSSGLRTSTTRSTLRQFTPYGLAAGHRYWFRVRALNGGYGSSASAAVSGVPRTAEQALRVESYNVLEGHFAGDRRGSETVGTWAQRRPGVVALVKRTNPDVLNIQEASSWVGSPQGRGGTRQVDDLRRALGGAYALARTEVPPSEPGYLRHGVYVLYRSADWRPAATGGVVTTGTGHFSAYQLLKNVHTGATVVAVSPHLPAGAGASADKVRATETTRLLSWGTSYGAKVGAPVVYAGDFNSNTSANHAFDGPGGVMAGKNVADAVKAATTLTNANYNSCNQYLRTPPAHGDSIDHLYAPAGVAVRSFGVVVVLRGGKFVGVIPSDHNPVLADLLVRR